MDPELLSVIEDLRSRLGELESKSAGVQTGVIDPDGSSAGTDYSNLVDQVLSNTAGVGVIVHEDGFIVDFDHAARKIFGIAENAPQPKQIWSLFAKYQPDGEDSETKYQALMQASEKGTDGFIEWECVDAKGEIFESILASSKIAGGSGNRTVILVSHILSQDDHGYLQAYILADAIQKSNVGFLIAYAPDFDIFVANRHAQMILGAPNERVTDIPMISGQENHFFFYPDGTAYRMADLPLTRAILNGEACEDREMIIQRNDGEKRWISCNCTPTYDAEGGILTGTMVFRDISDRKRLEKELADKYQLRRYASELSIKLGHMDVAYMAEAISESLSEMGEILSVDRVSLEWLEPGFDGLVQLRQRAPDAGRKNQVDDQAQKWLFTRLRAGEVVVINSIEDFPPAAVDAVERCQANGIKSMLAVPLVLDREVTAALVLESHQEIRRWSNGSIIMAQILAEIYAHNIARVRSAKRQRESNQRIEYLIDANFAPVFSAVDGRVVMANHQACEFFGLKHHALIGKAVVDLVDAKSRELVLGNKAEINEQSFESVWLSADGTSIPVLCRTTTLEEKGEHIRIFMLQGQSGDRLLQQKLDAAEAKLKEMDALLQEEDLDLEDGSVSDLDLVDFVGKSPAITKCLQMMTQVAPTKTSVLILGETGTGKEFFATKTHELSGRSGPIVSLNCAALPEQLIETELFGHEKGAFTDAQRLRKGRFEQADGGTLFLDEIGDLPLALQGQLLRVLQEGVIERVGGNTEIAVDVRILAATNRDLTEMVNRGEFRADLFYRLNVFPLNLPPLRDRKDDVVLLAQHFATKYARLAGKKVATISKQTMRAFKNHSWPGNIRELANVIEGAMITCNGPTLHIPDYPRDRQKDGIDLRKGGSQIIPTLFESEERNLLEALEHCAWKIEGPSGAAKILDVAPSSLRSKMKKHKISRASANK